MLISGGALGALRLATDLSRPADQRALEIWGGGSAAALLATIALAILVIRKIEAKFAEENPS